MTGTRVDDRAGSEPAGIPDPPAAPGPIAPLLTLTYLGDADAGVCVDGVCAVPKQPGD